MYLPGVTFIPSFMFHIIPSDPIVASIAASDPQRRCFLHLLTEESKASNVFQLDRTLHSTIGNLSRTLHHPAQSKGAQPLIRGTLHRYPAQLPWQRSFSGVAVLLARHRSGSWITRTCSKSAILCMYEITNNTGTRKMVRKIAYRTPHPLSSNAVASSRLNPAVSGYMRQTSPSPTVQIPA